jgi:hypothetical protein
MDALYQRMVTNYPDIPVRIHTKLEHRIEDGAVCHGIAAQVPCPDRIFEGSIAATIDQHGPPTSIELVPHADSSAGPGHVYISWWHRE